MHSRCAENRNFNANESTVRAPEENNLSGEHECILARASGDRSDLIKRLAARASRGGSSARRKLFRPAILFVV